jgi:MscS family membrane protein
VFAILSGCGGVSVVGLHPKYPPLKKKAFATHCEFVEVDSLQLTFQWQPFPRPADDFADMIQDVTYELRLWTTTQGPSERLRYNRDGMIFLDKPYQVGQRVNVLGQDGTVEGVGLRSTKIRLLNGHLTSIPNEKMAAAEVVNIGRRPHIRRLFNVTITYDTPPEKINRALEILQEILVVPEAPDKETTHAATQLADDHDEKQADTSATTQAPPAPAAMIEDIASEYHPNWVINRPDFEPRISFNEFNADSLNIQVIYWYHPPDYWAYLDHASWINTRIVERFNAEGIDFAFPTQNLHLAGDEKRPLDVGQRVAYKDDAATDSGTAFENGAVSDSAGT